MHQTFSSFLLVTGILSILQFTTGFSEIHTLSTTFIKNRNQFYLYSSTQGDVNEEVAKLRAAAQKARDEAQLLAKVRYR